MANFFHLLNFTLSPIIRLYIRKVHGKIPQGPFIIVANHESYLDPFFMLATFFPRIPKKIHFLANRGRFWSRFGNKFSHDLAGCVPLDKGHGQEALDELQDWLKKGDLVALFPGGARSLDGNMTQGHTGAVRLSMASKVPILPVGIVGAFEIAPRNNLIPRFRRAEIFIGKPLHLIHSTKKIEDNTRIMMKEISKLCNKKYDF